MFSQCRVLYPLARYILLVFSMFQHFSLNLYTIPGTYEMWCINIQVLLIVIAEADHTIGRLDPVYVPGTFLAKTTAKKSSNQMQ